MLNYQTLCKKTPNKQIHIISKNPTLVSALYITVKKKTPLILTTVTTVTLCLGVGFVCINGGKKKQNIKMNRPNESHENKSNLQISFSRNQFNLIKNTTEVSCSQKTSCRTYRWKRILTFESMLKKVGKQNFASYLGTNFLSGNLSLN